MYAWLDIPGSFNLVFNICEHGYHMVLIHYSGRYFEEVSLNNGMICYGVEDTFRALEMGAMETLVVWENLDMNRFVLKNNQTSGELGHVIYKYIS